MTDARQLDDLTDRCRAILREAGVPEKAMWLVEVQSVEMFGRDFPDMAEHVTETAGSREHDAVVYHHQRGRITQMETFKGDDSADGRRACRQLAHYLVTAQRQLAENRYLVECEHCEATGMSKGRGKEKCPACGGTGYLPTGEGLELIDALNALKPWLNAQR